MNFEAVLFDCDGVLVDSEGITNGVLRQMLAEMGWVLGRNECMRLFVGKAVKDETALIEANTGQRIDEDWLAQFRARRDAALQRDLCVVPNAHEAVNAVHAHYGGRVACASGADRVKVELQLRKVALMPYFEGRIFSGHETPRSKPAPDVYLAAAHALGAQASRCVVVEDSVPGVLAGVASGATVFGLCAPGAGVASVAELRNAGATTIFTDMAQLAGLVNRSA